MFQLKEGGTYSETPLSQGLGAPGVVLPALFWVADVRRISSVCFSLWVSEGPWLPLMPRLQRGFWNGGNLVLPLFPYPSTTTVQLVQPFGTFFPNFLFLF